MVHKDKISVIVPIYKVEEYIDECVASIINQTYKNLEIILVDDGSPDRCPQICDEWARKDPRIKVIHKANGGLSSARNAGLHVAKGEYIGFVDSDDFIEPDMYEKLLNTIRANKNCTIASCLIYTYKDGCRNIFKPQWTITKDRALIANEFAEKLLPERANFTVWSKLYRASLLQGIRFREGRINEDSLFVFDLSKEMERQHYIMLEIPYRGYNYRQRPNSICSNTQKPLALDTIENFTMMLDYYVNEGNKRMVGVLRHYLSLRYVRFANQVLQNEKWKLDYSDVANRYLKSVELKDILSMSPKGLLRFVMLRYLPNVYIAYSKYCKRT